MFLYLIRHGEPDYENDCLTERGKMQAQILANRLKDSGLDKIYVSPLGRAKETAEYTCRLIGKEPTVLDWAKEISGKTVFPDGVEKSTALLPNVYQRMGKNFSLDFDDAFFCDGFDDPELKQGYERVVNGLLAFLEEQGFKAENGNFTITKPNTEKIAIFCHGNMIRSLVSYLLHIPLHIMWAGFGLTFTGVTVINFNNSERGFCAPRVLTYADISHLKEDGKPLRYNDEIYL